MIKRLLIIASVAVLTACSASYKDNTGEYSLPDGLKDCKIYTIKADDSISYLTVVRCPLSSTSATYKSGKTTRYVSAIEL